MGSDLLDLTLKKWLLLELKCCELDACDIVSLSAQDVVMAGGERKTLADVVDENNFEHIRLRLASPLSLGVISQRVLDFFTRTERTMVRRFCAKEGADAEVLIIKDYSEVFLTVTILMESELILNITTVSAKGLVGESFRLVE